MKKFSQLNQGDEVFYVVVPNDYETFPYKATAAVLLATDVMIACKDESGGFTLNAESMDKTSEEKNLISKTLHIFTEKRARDAYFKKSFTEIIELIDAKITGLRSQIEYLESKREECAGLLETLKTTKKKK